MWFILVMVAIPTQWIGANSVFIFNDPTFQTSQACVQWVQNNQNYVAFNTLKAYPNATGHEGIFCVSDSTLQQMIEDGALSPNIGGVSL